MTLRFNYYLYFICVNYFLLNSTYVLAEKNFTLNKIEKGLSVMVLGSGGAIASHKNRASSAYIIFTDGKPRILMDAGGGTFARIAESDVDLKDLDIVLLSHLHIDHTADLSAILKSIYLHNFRAQTKRLKKLSPVNFFGPQENKVSHQATAYDSTSHYLNTLYDQKYGIERYLYGFAKAINAGEFSYTSTNIQADYFNNKNGEKKPAKIRVIIEEPDGLIVKAIGVEHGPVPSLAYRIEYKGKSITYTGDTTSKTNNLIRLSENTDILIYDTAIMDELPPADSVFRKFHTSPTRIAQVAKQAKVKKLVLSHLSPLTDKHQKKLISIIRNNGVKSPILIANDLAIYNLN